MTTGGTDGPQGAELGDGHRVVGQDLEQERLELVVGPVDLVDEQHRRRPFAVVDGRQDGPADQEPLGVQLVLQVGAQRPARRLGGDRRGPQVQQLAGVVPLVDGLGHVDALVALQAQQLAAGPRREDLGHLGLAHAGLALEQQRPVEDQGQEDRRGQALVGQVSLVGEGRGDVFDAQSGGSGGPADRVDRAWLRQKPTGSADPGFLQRPPDEHLGQVPAVLGAGVEVSGRVEAVGCLGRSLGRRRPAGEGLLGRRRPAPGWSPC